MLSIKQLYNKFFNKQPIKTSSDLDFKNDCVVMTFGLTHNYEIDLSLEVKDLLIKDNNDMEFKAKKLASFLHTVVSGGLNNIIIEFLMKEMSDEQNKQLFESVIYQWLVLDKYHAQTQKTKNNTMPVVSPLKAFIPYINK